MFKFFINKIFVKYMKNINGDIKTINYIRFQTTRRIMTWMLATVVIIVFYSSFGYYAT